MFHTDEHDGVRARKVTQLVSGAMLVGAIVSLIPGYQMPMVGRIVAVLGIGAGLVLVRIARELSSAGALRRITAIGGTLMMFGGVASLCPGAQQGIVGVAAAAVDGTLALLLFGLAWESSRRV